MCVSAGVPERDRNERMDTYSRRHLLDCNGYILQKAFVRLAYMIQDGYATVAVCPSESPRTL